MDIIITLLQIVFFIILIGIAYSYYQLLRSEVAGKIINKWEKKKDSRYHKYSHSELVKPNRKNYFGFNIPRNKLYK